MRSACEALTLLPSSADLVQTSRTAADGAVRGARGNSGLLVSQALAALAELLRACLPVVHAARALIAAITHPSQPPADTDQEDADPS